MKKGILKIFGVAALAAGMLYNVQVSDIENVMDVSLAALGSMAMAQSEGGETQSCSYNKYEMRLNPSTGKYENVLVSSCTATCISPDRPDCDQFRCTCV